jgi:orotidine-5'-phosphate decarboxylase
MSTFYDKFITLRNERKSLLCVGLDPDTGKIPPEYTGENAVFEFLRDIIDATHQNTVAYKPNLAFFESLGYKGLQILEKTIQHIRKNTSNPLIIADAKRGDIGNTAEHYAKAFFEFLDCDAVTLNPYMGMDTIEPFAKYKDRACIILCLTSNPGALQFEMHGNPPLYERVAQEASLMNKKTGNIWLVVGATRETSSIQKIQAIAPEVPFLIPGIGAQGGDLESVLKIAGKNCLINVSRNILYSEKHRDRVTEGAKREAESLTRHVQILLKF